MNSQIALDNLLAQSQDDIVYDALNQFSNEPLFMERELIEVYLFWAQWHIDAMAKLSQKAKLKSDVVLM